MSFEVQVSLVSVFPAIANLNFCFAYRILNYLISFIVERWFRLTDVSITIGEFGFFFIKGVKICWNVNDPGLVCNVLYFSLCIIYIYSNQCRSHYMA